MQKMKINELIPHPKNNYFFDDMNGEKWNEFLESIKTSGVIEPIVITQNKVIVSGHQRVRACKQLGIEGIMAEIKLYDSDDKIIKDLLETNLRQRGDIGGSSIKMGRIIKELERIYEIKHGGDRSNSNNVGVETISQDNLLRQLGLNKETYRQIKSLTTLPQEIQDLIEQGNITTSTASRLIAKLPPEEQEELIATLPTAQKLTQKQVQSYIDQIQSKDKVIVERNNQIAGYKLKTEKVEEMKKHISELESQLAAQTEPIVKTVIKETIPEDYENLKGIHKQLELDYQRQVEKNNDLEAKLNLLKESSAKYQASQMISNDCIMLTNKVNRFIRETGGLAYVSSEIQKLDKKDRETFKNAVQSMAAWATNILNCIKEN